jgi:hypothetical protein
MQESGMEYIVLSNDLFLAKGGERDTYQHPKDRTKVIKVVRNSKVHNNQNVLDFTYFNYLKKHNVDLSHITKCYGWVNTNIGTGLIFDRVENYDGTAIKTFSYYSKHNLLNKETSLSLVNELKDYLFKNNILFVDASLSNIFCQKISPDRFKLIVFDGLGGRRTGFKFRLYMWMKIFAKYKIRKQWNKFMRNYKYETGLMLPLN